MAPGRTHGAGFQCYIEGAAVEPVIADCQKAAVQHRKHFRVGRGIYVANQAVLRAGNDHALMHDDRSDWHLAPSACEPLASASAAFICFAIVVHCFAIIA